jgi:peptidoglycan L-alanyl-D-glutamate endopeptidase CwlK
MSLVSEQAEFLLHVCKLVEFATQHGFTVTGGELERKVEMQEIYVRTGRSKTLNSRHLSKCAVDLNFFEQVDGRLKLTYEIPRLKPIGEFWEQLSPKNSWGGHWNSFKDVPHFERRA